MSVKFLFSSISPMLVKEGEETINDCFREEIKKADRLEISVGFASFASLKELDRLITENNIKNVSVILGMYYFNGFPKLLHQLALEINKKWQDAGIGEIRIISSFRYHGKLYCFLKDNQAFSAILGSANLSFLVANETTRLHQYEIALFVDDAEVLESSLKHISELKVKDVSENIAALEDLHVLFDNNPHLENIKDVPRVEEKVVTELEQEKSINALTIPLAVPSKQEALSSNKSDFSNSDLNACYGKSKSWFDVELTIDSKATLPSESKWFYIFTDDGYEFRAHFSGNKNKKLSSWKNKEILGRWIKGRLAYLELVKDFEDISQDPDKEGIITKEILQNYGGNQLLLKKTKKTKKDKRGVERDIWFLSFPRKLI